MSRYIKQIKSVWLKKWCRYYDKCLLRRKNVSSIETYFTKMYYSREGYALGSTIAKDVGYIANWINRTESAKWRVVWW